MPEAADSITRLLERAHEGDGRAADELFSLVYEELHSMAVHRLRNQGPEHTLQPTALVNEAYLRVFRGEWNNREHFRAVAARAMRSILVDHARRKRRQKRSAEGVRVLLDDLIVAFEERSGDLLGLDEALERLARIDPTAARLVELRFFGGQSMPEVAHSLGISLRSAQREWATARAWLREELR